MPADEPQAEVAETCPMCLGSKGDLIRTRLQGSLYDHWDDCLLCAGYGVVHPTLAAKYRAAKEAPHVHEAR